MWNHCCKTIDGVLVSQEKWRWMEAEEESQLLLPSYDAAGSDRTGASSLFGTVMSHLELVHFDGEFWQEMKNKLDMFYFNHYLD